MHSLILIITLFLLNVISRTEGSFKNYSPEMKECYDKFIPTLQECTEKVAVKWNCATVGDNKINLSCGEGEGHECCPFWDIFECQKSAVKDYCGLQTLKEFNAIVFDPQITSLENKDCPNYRYLSKACVSLLDYDKKVNILPPHLMGPHNGLPQTSDEQKENPTKKIKTNPNENLDASDNAIRVNTLFSTQFYALVIFIIIF